MPYAVELRGITKRFPGVVANRDIELRVARGEVHAIVGENGAGKSTLMKTLYGMHRPDEGAILLDGREVHFRSPADAIAAGIGMVHQHFMLADNFTVLENIVLGSEPTRGLRLDRARARDRITEISDRYALDLEPDVLVEELGVGDRQRVEIAKVLYRARDDLILDEPTAVLVPQEVDELFGNLAELKREGLTVIFISHKLDEVRKVADSITVIRRGTTVGEADPRTTTARQLAEMMVGAELPSPETRTSTVRDTVVLELRGVTVGPGWPLRSSTASTSSSARARSWASPASRATARPSSSTRHGAAPARCRTSSGGDEDITAWSTRAPRGGRRPHPRGPAPPGHAAGGDALGEPHPRAPDAPPAAKGWFIDRKAARADTERIMKEYDVRAPGGHARRRALRRQPAEADRRPRDGVLSAAARRGAPHPRRRRRRPGGDLGAAQGRTRRKGMAILLISADLDELIGLSDTLTVMLRGRLVATLDPATCTPEQLGGHMTGANAAAGAA